MIHMVDVLPCKILLKQHAENTKLISEYRAFPPVIVQLWQ